MAAAFPLGVLYETLQVRTLVIYFTLLLSFLSAATLCLASDLDLDNGEIDIPDPITIDSVARFECNDGRVLDGPTTRVCEAGGWSGMNPTCSE